MKLLAFVLLSLIFLLRFATAAENAAPLATAPANYDADIQKWRAKAEEDLKGPSSWLTLIALEWLEKGENSFGTAKKSKLKLPKGSAPEHAGTFTLDSGKVYFDADAKDVTVNGAAPTKHQLLNPDASGKPDHIQAGRITITVVDRSGQIGLRVKDPESPTRKHFKHREWYPVKDAYRVQATFEAAPTEITFGNAIGQTLHEKSPGTVSFTLEGKPYKLVALGDLKEGLSFIFRDKTSGKTTYGAGRFLDAEPTAGNTITLDFNKAYSPPCAFTRFATCPLPPKENALSAMVEAGEKGVGNH